MIQTGEFVFAKEEIKFRGNGTVNLTYVAFYDDTALLKEENEKITYCFISADSCEELEEKN